MHYYCLLGTSPVGSKDSDPPTPSTQPVQDFDASSFFSMYNAMLNPTPIGRQKNGKSLTPVQILESTFAQMWYFLSIRPVLCKSKTSS